MAAERRQLFQKRDRLRQLQAFCYAAKFGSMTRAAEQLLISQPAVSLHVRELEYELETVLFERNGPRIALSRAGECFYELATPLVDDMADLARGMADELEEITTGELRVASGDAGATHVLPRVFKRLRDYYPGIHACLRVAVLGEGLDMLLSGEVELVFGARGPSSEEVEYRPVLTYELVLITSRDHRFAGRESVTPEEIADCPVIVPDFGTYSLQSGESPLRHLGIEGNVVIEVGGWDVVEHYVEAGLGIAFCPSFCLTGTSPVSVVPLGQYFSSRSYGWFMQRGRPLSWQAERLLEAMAAEYPVNSSEIPLP